VASEAKRSESCVGLVLWVAFQVTGLLKLICFVLSATERAGKQKLMWTNNPWICIPVSADGVALGAAASTSQTSVQLIVFVAIMLHKVSHHPKNLSWFLKDC